MDWKDYLMKAFKETQTLFVSTGADVLATDYKLSKHPLMQKLFDRQTIVAEFTNTFHAFEALLQMSDAVIQRSNVKQSFQLWPMFEADDDQKAITVDKKEQQKIEDDAEKAEKHISNYVDKQMAMLISADKYKERGLDKATA